MATLITLRGYWDASTNTPTLLNGTGTIGDLYQVSIQGSQSLGPGSPFITFPKFSSVLYISTGQWIGIIPTFTLNLTEVVI